MSAPPLLYNLFPRLVGPIPRWPEHAERARRMGFDWLYLNPWHYPGFSGSLYAPKEFRRLNPLFVPEGGDEHDLDVLRDALRRIRVTGMRPMIDLVINHTSKDSPLADAHPQWYVRDEHGALVSPWVANPDDPEDITVWGDLAEIDNAGSADREALWAYWAELVRDSLALGFEGFRCDAAYMVPSDLWRYLIEEARQVDPDAAFFAETLGAPAGDIRALADAGFDYFFNSSKWWDFQEPWALEQHEEFRHIAPSIAFPESHDTPRLAGETGGDAAVQRQRYAFAAAFSAGVMMPVGYEFGFRRQVNVVETMPSDWEDPSFDLTPFISRVNHLKRENRLLHGEGVLQAPAGLEDALLILERRSSEADAAAGWILVNRSAEHGYELEVRDSAVAPALAGPYRLYRVCRDSVPREGEAVPDHLSLERAEVAYVLPVRTEE